MREPPTMASMPLKALRFWLKWVRIAVGVITCALLLSFRLPSSAAAAEMLTASRPVPALVQANRVSSIERMPRPSGGERVSDRAGLLSQERRKRIAEVIARQEERSQSEIRVVTLPSIGARHPKYFATELFNRWEVGRDEPGGRGVLILIVRDRRRIEIEVNRGLNGVLSRTWTEDMLQRKVLPHLRANHYGMGLEKAVDAVGAQIVNGGAFDGVFETALVVVGGTSWAGFSIHFERQSRKCEGCGAIVRKRNIGKWRTIEEATHLHEGRKERRMRCQACGVVKTQSKTVPKYDGVRYDRYGTPRYYFYDSSDSSDGGGGGGSDGGGGGGGDF